MNTRVYFATGSASGLEPIEELSVVRLIKDTDIDLGRLPAGACGTVVCVYRSGEAYLVEFEEPFHALATLEAELMEAVPGKGRADISASI